jgi:glycosyltransferase involved in cell wall biosynthesis
MQARAFYLKQASYYNGVMAKIVIDGRIYGTGWTGIGRYTERLIEELQQIDQDNEYVVLLRKDVYEHWQPLNNRWRKVMADFKPYGLREQLYLPWLLWRLRPDLVHFLHFTIPCLYLGRRLITIHDLTLVRWRNVRGGTLKRFIYSVKYWLMRLVLRCGVMRSVGIITPTEQTKQEILEAYPTASPRWLSPDKVTPIHEAADPVMAEPEEMDIKKPFLLYVGNAYDYKNLYRLVEAFRLLKPDFPDLKLVLAGKIDYFYSKLQDWVGNDPSVIFPGFVNDSQLVWLYQNAEAFVFPSLAEGFGLPPLEAMAHGTPVLSSNASCMPEVLGDTAIYFDPTDTKNMAETIEALLNSPEEQERLRRLGPEQTRKYSWQRMAKETLAQYERVLKK